MSQTPIFDQLASEFASVGKPYETMRKPIPTGLPKRVRPYTNQQVPPSVVLGIRPSSTVAIDVSKIAEQDTVILPKVQPLSERNTA